jgi:hypothetical protein
MVRCGTPSKRLIIILYTLLIQHLGCFYVKANRYRSPSHSPRGRLPQNFDGNRRQRANSHLKAVNDDDDYDDNETGEEEKLENRVPTPPQNREQIYSGGQRERDSQHINNMESSSNQRFVSKTSPSTSSEHQTNSNPSAQVQWMVTNQMRSELSRLGYTHHEIRDIDPRVARVVINRRLVRPLKGMPPNWKRRMVPMTRLERYSDTRPHTSSC